MHLQYSAMVANLFTIFKNRGQFIYHISIRMVIYLRYLYNADNLYNAFAIFGYGS